MINWLIEEFSRDNSFLEIRNAAIKRGHKVKIVESIPFFYDPHWSIFPKHSNTVFLGSIGCAKQLQRAWEHHMWDPGVWINWWNYKCSVYYAYWGDYVFNRTYSIMPLADFEREKEIYTEPIFIRPDSGDKPFTGQVWTQEDLTSKLWQISTEDMQPHDLLLISTAKRIKREWRVVCTANPPRVITGSRYKTEGQVDYRRELPEEVQRFVEKVIATKWQPDPIYIVDICQDSEDMLWLLEIGAFNVAGLYHCDFDLIVEAVEEIVGHAR